MYSSTNISCLGYVLSPIEINNLQKVTPKKIIL